MDAEYKLKVVDELPPRENTKPIPSNIGGFGLPEDDLILQMVVEKLHTNDSHPESVDQLNVEDDF